MKAIQPPSRASIQHTMRGLRAIKALEEDEKQESLTPLGFHLAALPVDVRIGKMMLYACIFRCLDPVLTIAAGMSLRSPFYAPIDKRELADDMRKRFTEEASDHITVLKAYRGWLAAKARGEERVYANKYFLSLQTLQTMRDMKRQFIELLAEIGFVPRTKLPKRTQRVQLMEGTAVGGGGATIYSDGILEATGAALNSHSDNLQLVTSVLVAGLYPNFVQVKGLGAFADKVNKASSTSAGASSSGGDGVAGSAPSPAPAQGARQGGKVFDSSASSLLKYSTLADGDVEIHPTSGMSLQCLFSRRVMSLQCLFSRLVA